MNHYSLEELSVGLTASFEVTVTEEMMAAFRAMTGDCNPLHCDEAYAKADGQPGRVVYGMLAASLYSTLAGVYLPGEACLLHGVDVKFRRAVYIGDSLHVSGTVSEISEALRRITIKAETRNGHGEKVNSAVITAGVRLPRKETE